VKTDILIVGCGAAGLFCALNMPRDKKVTIITKDKAENSDSYLAQGGICVLKEPSDYDSFFNDTLKAGHYENDKESVDIMIKSSKEVILDIIDYGVEFKKINGEFDYTKEGAHSKPRILYHEDETGKEITTKLLNAVKKLKNVTLIEDYTMVDIITSGNECFGVIGHNKQNEFSYILADYTVFATGGIGGLYEHSTNFRHITGDAIAIALNYGIKLKHLSYIQIHPTSFYSEQEGRKFLISESVRGEGAILLNSKGERFVDELLPRDVVTEAITKEMQKEGSKHVWLNLSKISVQEIKEHFPNIYKHCLENGYDITKDSIPVVPSQHYFMGGIWVDKVSKTSMDRLYAIGETSCNGVHGKNRLASNSLLESLVFAKRSAKDIASRYKKANLDISVQIDTAKYANYKQEYKQKILNAIKGDKYE